MRMDAISRFLYAFFCLACLMGCGEESAQLTEQQVAMQDASDPSTPIYWFDKALEQAKAIESPEHQSQRLLELTECLVQIGAYEQARSIAESAPDARTACAAWCTIAIGYYEADSESNGKRAIEKADELIEKMSKPDDLVYAKTLAGRAYGYTGDESGTFKRFDQAMLLAGEIKDPMKRAERWAWMRETQLSCPIVPKIAHRYGGVHASLNQIADPVERFNAQLAQLREHHEAGRTKEASELVTDARRSSSAIKDPVASFDALCDVIDIMLEIDHRHTASAAQTLALKHHNLTDEKIKAQKLIEVARYNAKAGRDSAVDKIIERFEHPDRKSKLVAEIAMAYTEVGNQKRVAAMRDTYGFSDINESFILIRTAIEMNKRSDNPEGDRIWSRALLNVPLSKFNFTAQTKVIIGIEIAKALREVGFEAEAKELLLNLKDLIELISKDQAMYVRGLCTLGQIAAESGWDLTTFDEAQAVINKMDGAAAQKSQATLDRFRFVDVGEAYFTTLLDAGKEDKAYQLLGRIKDPEQLAKLSLLSMSAMIDTGKPDKARTFLKTALPAITQASAGDHGHEQVRDGAAYASTLRLLSPEDLAEWIEGLPSPESRAVGYTSVGQTRYDAMREE